jgi:hypothetical protein
MPGRRLQAEPWTLQISARWMPRPKLATAPGVALGFAGLGQVVGELRRVAVATSLSKSRKPRYCSFFDGSWLPDALKGV